MLHGLSISAYRSFGQKDQRLTKTDKLNLLVGKNNVGKSNVLRTITYFLPAITSGNKAPWDNDLDKVDFNKVKIAHCVVENGAKFRLDWNQKIAELIAFIKASR